MLLDRLYKAAARVVLVSYTTTNLLAPLAHACELGEPTTHRSSNHLLQELDKNLSSKENLSLKTKETLQLEDDLRSTGIGKEKIRTVPTDLLEGLSEKNLSTRPNSSAHSTTSADHYVEDYQYRLRVKTLGTNTERFQLKLSRKEKPSPGSAGKFERLYTATINKGSLTTTNSDTQDTLLNLFKGAKTYRFLEGGNTTCFMWDVSHFGTLKLGRDGSVFFDQGPEPLLLAYDLILKTSGELFLQSLGVSELTLQSPQTTILGAVVTNRLDMDHEVINEGGLQTKQLTGQGTFTNHATLKLGTSDQPAIMGVGHLINKKGNGVSKEAKIESTHLHITSDNQSFINEENSEIRVEDTLLVDPSSSSSFSSPFKKSSFINKGILRLHKATFNREASNDGYWQAHQMVVEQGDFTNQEFGTLNILDQLALASNLINEGDITVKNLLKLERGENKGSIKGEALFLETQGSFRNAGDMYLKAITGPGIFYNDNLLKFSAPDKRHGSIDVAHFKNGGNTQSKTRAKITGGHVLIADENQDFSNYAADIFVERLQTTTQGSTVPLTYFINTGHIESKTIEVDSGSGKHQWDNSGAVKTSHLQLSGNRLIFYNMPTGTLKTNSLTSTASRLNNRGDIQVQSTLSVSGFDSSQGSKLTADTLEVHKGGRFINSLKSTLTVHKELKADDALLQNDGEMVSQGKFVQQTGEFINTGLWDHQGDLDLGSAELINKGEMVWQNGKWAFTPTRYDNFGSWTFDQISCSKPFTIHNHGVLRLKNGAITFQHIINHQNLIFSAGQYILTGGLQNNHLMKFQEHDWTFTDDLSITTPNRLVFHDKGHFLGYASSGEIEVEKSLTYDVQTLPKLIRSHGDIVFPPRHHKTRNLRDLEKVITPGKVSFCTPAIKTTQDYEFANIGHLALYVDGLFTTHHSFKARGLTLDVNGSLICGLSNSVMGTLAATDGPLTVTAHSYDGRFGKMYGAGPTVVKSTHGDIVVGAAAQGMGTEENTQYAMSIRNGAFIASGNTLLIDSVKDLLVDYGETNSVAEQKLKSTQLIRNTAGKISAAGIVLMEAPQYVHTRGGINAHGYHSGIINGSPGTYYDYLLSGPALLESSSGIYFNINHIKNVASHILSGGDILNFGQKLKGFSSYIEEAYNLGYCVHRGHYGLEAELMTNGMCHCVVTASYSSNYLNFPCITSSAKTIQINTGDFIVSGSMNSPIIKIDSTDGGMFYNNNRIRQILVPKEILHNLTQSIQSKAKGNGFWQITSDGEVKTAFPFGKPHTPDPSRMLMFETGSRETGSQIPIFNPTNIFNPLKNLSSDFLSLSIQSALSELAGKVYVKGGYGKGLLKALEDNAYEFSRKTNKNIVTRDDIKGASAAMLLYGVQQVGTILQQQAFLCVPPDEINPYQSSGDVSGNEITIKTAGNQTHLNNRIVARDMLDVVSTKGSISRETQKYTTHQQIKDGSITQDVSMPQQQFVCEGGDVNVFAHHDLSYVGVSTQAGRDILETAERGGIEKEPLILRRIVEINKEEDDGWFSSKTTSEISTSHTISPTTTRAGRNIIESSGKGIHLIGAKETAGEDLIYNGPSLTTEASMVVNTNAKTSTTSGLFSDRTDASSFSTISAEPTELVAKNIFIKVNSATFKGTDFAALILEDNTKEGIRFGPSIGKVNYSQKSVSESPLSSSDVGCEGWYEVMQPCRFMINQIIRNLDEGEIKLESVMWDKDRTEIIGKFAETAYELKKHHREWAIHEQVIPNEALVVVALAISLATYGTGGKLFASSVTSMTGGTMVATGTGMAMASAGFTTLCSSAATSFLRTGDPIQTGKEMLSSQSLRSLAISVASAGLTQNIGDRIGLQLDPKKMSFVDYARKNGLEFVIKAPLNSVIARQSIPESLRDGTKSFVIDTISQYACNQIGKLYVKGQEGQSGGLTDFEHKFWHGIVGAGSGALLKSDDRLKGALSGGMGAVLSEVMAEHFVDPKAIERDIRNEARRNGDFLTKEELNTKVQESLRSRINMVRVATASLVTIGGLDPTTSIVTINNALDNNFMPSMTKNLMQMYSEEEESEYGSQQKSLSKDELFEDAFPDAHDLYYQNALEKAFPNEEPSKIEAVVKGIKEFRKEYPRWAYFMDQSFEGIGVGLQYSAYASGYLLGFSGGGFVGGSLGFSMVKSLEEPVGNAFRYGIDTASNWYASGGKTPSEIYDRMLAFQELSAEVLPPLMMLARIKGTKPPRFGVTSKDFKATHVAIPSNQNRFMCYGNKDRSIAVSKVLADFEGKTGFFTPLEQPQLKLGDGKQTQSRMMPERGNLTTSMGRTRTPEEIQASREMFKKILARIDEKRGIPKPLAPSEPLFYTYLGQPRLRLVDGKQTQNLSLVNSKAVDKSNVLGRQFEAKDVVLNNLGGGRNNKGTSHVSVPLVNASTMLRGTHGNAGNVPLEVAKMMENKVFNSFDQFRGEFWKSVSSSKYAEEFNPYNIGRMERGLAPEAHPSQWIGMNPQGGKRGTVYELHHKTPIYAGGEVFDLSNILIVTPKGHAEILEKTFHYGK